MKLDPEKIARVISGPQRHRLNVLYLIAVWLTHVFRRK